ncbi:hypothetical protein BKA65DRAFT_203576 [Rhexocercosporidium sp. MPI-PUGE-AT-0058]|nr:hypothetical protein BKA65DRAFT_203576 [Rhexocercosporidium sp. MPI-PUGE-AT-0058]
MMSQAHATRQPLGAVQNRNRVNARTAPIRSAALKQAINNMDATRLRLYLHHYCGINPEMRQDLERDLLVKGKDVDRYHRDTDSENDAESEIESSEEEDDEDTTDKEREKPIPLGDEEFAPKYAECENCNEQFDISSNDTRECHWHSGEKELDYDGDFWADHDEDCHGDPASFEDDSDFGGGFIWPCCKSDGNNPGCKTTKHKAPVNVIQVAGSNKRRAEEELEGPDCARQRL